MSSPAPPLPARLRYALGGRLPEHRGWVRDDLTSAGWRLRTFLRVVVQALPFAVLLALLPGPGYVHVLLPLFVLLAAAFVGGAYADDLRDRRMHQHGLEPPPAAEPAGWRDLDWPGDR